MHEPPRLPGGRHEIVPAAGRHVAAVQQPGQPRGNRVRAVEIVEKPAVQPFRAEGALNAGDVERHIISIQSHRTNYNGERITTAKASDEGRGSDPRVMATDL